jgi:hypothetical protein
VINKNSDFNASDYKNPFIESFDVDYIYLNSQASTDLQSYHSKMKVNNDEGFEVFL